MNGWHSARRIFSLISGYVTWPLARLPTALRTELGAVLASRRATRKVSILFELAVTLTFARPPRWRERSRQAYRAIIRRLSPSRGAVGTTPDEDVPRTAYLLVREARRPVVRLVVLLLIALGSVLAIAAAASFVAMQLSPRVHRWLLPPDLAPSSRWTASSTFPGTPAATNGSANAAPFFFHTNSEHHPWVRFDLPYPANIRRIAIKTRTDCCLERSVPLNVEILDGKHWKLVCQRRVPFSSWTCHTGNLRTSAVRITLAADNMLHLSSVEIFE